MNDPVLVFGGTRGAGLLIARLLQQRGDAVRVLARDPARAAELFPSGVEVVAGDITRPETLPAAVRRARHIVFTAGVHSGRAAPESLVKLTDHDGVVNALKAAREARFNGRFVYLNALGVTVPSATAGILNFFKRNTLVWRRRVEDQIRASGLDYAIIRVGFMMAGPGGRRAVKVSQTPLKMSPGHRIAYADVAEAFVAALDHPRASRATFDIVWGGGRRESWSDLFDRLKPDR